MTKRHIWQSSMNDTATKREKLLDSLYRHCQIRSSTSREVFDKIIADVELIGTSHIVDEALEIIRPYKNTGISLESTVDSLYALFYPTKTVESSSSKSAGDDDGYNMDWDPNSP